MSSSAPSSYKHHRHPLAVLLQLPTAEVYTHTHTYSNQLLIPTTVCYVEQDVVLMMCLYGVDSVSLLGKPPDSTVMSVATGKNLDAIPRKVRTHIYCCFS